jgi:alkanesulfonate monooxygenase SsuD/methylene tetrahydromethanopterin reductase-like flavin-dependent oxidoreductase (luciferase family)
VRHEQAQVSRRDSQKLRFGLGLPTSGPFAQPATILRFAQAAEQLGFDDVWVNDHVNFDSSRRGGSPAGSIEAVRDQDPDFFESITTAALVAGRVSRIGIALGGLVVPLRHPVLLAKQISTLHELSGRRVLIAPAIGGDRIDFAHVGKPWEQRGKLLDEYLDALHALWFGEFPVSFRGPTISFEGATLYPRPKGLRLWITGDSEPALIRTVKWGSGWFCAYPEPGEYASKLARLHVVAEAAGRDPTEIDTAAIVFVCMAATREQALALCGPTLARRFKSLERGLAVSVVGTADEVRQQFEARYRAGLRYLELRFITHDPEAALDMAARVSEDVIPSFSQAPAESTRAADSVHSAVQVQCGPGFSGPSQEAR